MNDIRIAGASAGTGKTYFLTHELAEAIGNGVSPASIVATTFTRKAAGELRERVRRLLIESGRSTDAQRVFDGYIGTVHSVCSRLLCEYAIDAGLSPAIEGMPEGDDTRFFRIGVSAIVNGYAAELERVAERLSVDGSGHGHAQLPDWRDEVKKVVELARSNGLSAEQLRACGPESVSSLATVLGANTAGAGDGASGTRRNPDGAAGMPEIAERVAEAANAVLPALQAIEEPKKKTQDAARQLETFVKTCRDGGVIRWSDFVRIAKQEVNKDATGLIDTVRQVAGGFVRSEAFFRDLEALICGVVNCAADALEAYAQYKRSQGLMDFADQETLVLNLARKNKRFRSGVRESVERIFVDEFQDTSPIQLALFMALHDLSGNSLWVGDPKQAIYGFRGTDPSLMNAAVKRLGTDTTLGESWRSRKELVRFSNAVFAPVLKARGYDSVELDIPEQRTVEAEGGRIETWYLSSTNAGNDAKATALGVARLLSQRSDLKPGEIAILCRKNDQCSAIADALADFGIDASVGHGTLSQAAECRLAMAALRFFYDERDTLALAEIVHTHPQHHAHGAWLAPLIDAPAETIEQWRTDPIMDRLERARDRTSRMAPDEALEYAISILGLPRLVATWSRSGRRRANLDTLRGLCGEYLDTCSAHRTAATVPGFIQYYRDQESGQATGSGDRTVQVLTYHGAKGLEWKFVVLTSLDAKPRTDSRAAFGVSVKTATDLHLDNPLAGRSIRYWPWPFGQQKNIPEVSDSIAASKQHRDSVETSHDESLRLLYVGITRAREELALVARKKASGDVAASWIAELTDNNGEAVIRWPAVNGKDVKHDPAAGAIDSLRAGRETFDTLVRFLAPEEETDSRPQRRPEAARYLQPLAVPAPRVTHPAAHLSPSSLIASDNAAGDHAAPEDITMFADLGDRIPIASGVDETTLGTALHAIFAAACPGISESRLVRVSERLLTSYDLAGMVHPADIASAHTRLTQELTSTYTIRRTHREWPISLRLDNGQQVNGWIDLLLETDQGSVIVDHKSFPGRDATTRIGRYAPQLRMYADALEAAGAGPVLARLIHLPVLGKVFEVK